MGSLADREAATVWESWESSKARDQRRAQEAKLEEGEQRKRMVKLAREELNAPSPATTAAAATAGAAGKAGSGGGGGGGGGGGVSPFGGKEATRAAIAAADASLLASSPMAAIAENKPVPADVFQPKKFDLYNHLGVLTVPILPAVQEFWKGDRTLHRRLERCFNRDLKPLEAASGCHAAALGFWTRIKQPDVYPTDIFQPPTLSPGPAAAAAAAANPTAAPAAAAAAAEGGLSPEQAAANRAAEPAPVTAAKMPETDAEWHAAFERMRGDDRQASVLFRLACAKGYDRACWNLGMMHHLGDVDMGYGASDADVKKTAAMDAAQLAAYRAAKDEIDAQDLQVVGTGMTRSDLLAERLTLYERMCHGNYQSAAVFCYLAGEETYVQVLRDRLRDEKEVRDRDAAAKRTADWDAQMRASTAGSAAASEAEAKRAAKAARKAAKQDAADKKRRAMAEELRKSLLVRARENFCKSSSFRPLGFRESKELKDSKMICKTFPGLIAHQAIRDNRLWRREMYGEGIAGGEVEREEEVALWGAASASAAAANVAAIKKSTASA